MREKIGLERILDRDYLVLYGIGNQFKELYKLIKGHNNIVLVDGDCRKQGTLYDGITIISPIAMKEYLTDKDYSVIVSSIKNQYEIAKDLINIYDIKSERLYMYTSEWYEKSIYKSELLIQHENEVKEIAKLLGDRESEEYYLSRYRAISERNPLLLVPNKNSKCIGEYGDVLKILPGERIIDGGAYTGDTVEYYIKRTNKNCRIYAFEPFRDSYKKLVEKVENNGWNKLVNCYNNAIGSCEITREIHYSNDTFDMSINLSSDLGTNVQIINVVPIDTVLGDRRISYIKMDIEGEEAEAIKGAADTIRRNHPKLMISGYHRIEDFWIIPKTIWEIDKSYRIFVSHAPNVSTEMEYYCV